MIKFFRRIRQKLVSQNKFSKYMFYAIGEIILVVIGILIALQVNTWNVDRLNGLEEERILRDLKEEIGPAIAKRDELILKVEQKRREFAIVLDKLFSSPARTLSDKDCINIWNMVYLRDYNVPYLSVVEELITSGNISIVKDPELRKQMMVFKNRSKINAEKFIKEADEIPNYSTEYPNLIIRSWEPSAQKSIYTCDAPGITKNKQFLAQLQSDRGKIRGLVIAARSELKILKKMDSLINTSN